MPLPLSRSSGEAEDSDGPWMRQPDTDVGRFLDRVLGRAVLDHAGSGPRPAGFLPVCRCGDVGDQHREGGGELCVTIFRGEMPPCPRRGGAGSSRSVSV